MKRFLALLLISTTGFGELAILNTFNAGELSPHMDARIDFEKYKSGLRTMENFTVLPYGGARKRSGTEYIAETKSGGVARLAPFSVGVDQTYVMEIGIGYIRFYSNGVQIQDGGSPLEVATPYGADDVFEVQLAQFADTIYMVHKDHPVQKLQRTTTAPTFTIEEVEWDYPPVMDENLTDITLTPSAITGSVTITASDTLFTTNHVGSSWVLRSPYDDNSVSLSLNADGISDELRIEGDWNLRTVGAGFEGILKLEVSEDNGATWGSFREYESRANDLRNYDRSGTESEIGVVYRLNFDETGDGGGTAYLKSESAYLNGWVTITNFISATQVVAEVNSPLGSTDATDIWFEGAFSEERGYPRTVEFYENRLWFGGTDYMVNTLWASKTADYETFQTGSYDDSSLRLSINSDNIIEWLLGRNQLFVGTLGDEWILSGGDSSTPITPTTVLARRQTGFGSKDGIDALIASDSILYLQRQGRKLREFEYSLESDAYKSSDVTMLAEHITKGGVVQIDDQQQPEPIIWCVRDDGQLLSMTYSKVQNVYGWSRHITDGEFESVAVIPTIGEDRIYVVANRDNGRYVEWLKPFEIDDEDEAWFVDSGLEYDGGDAVSVTGVSVATNGTITISAAETPSDGDSVRFSDVGGMVELEKYTFGVTNSTTTNFNLLVGDSLADGSGFTAWTSGGEFEEVKNTFTNVAHLAGQEVNIFADGGAQPAETVSTNGVLVTDEYYNHIVAGLQYTARLSPMYIDTVSQAGISYAKVKTPYKAHFRVKDSGRFFYGSTTNALYPVSVRSPNLPAGSPVPFFSGDPTTKTLEIEPSTAPEFWVTSPEPLPLELLSVTFFTKISEYE